MHIFLPRVSAWWRSQSIPRRFAAHATLGVLFAVVAYVFIRQSVFWAGYAFLVVLELAGLGLAYDSAFNAWRPKTLAGRFLRTYIYSFYWVRDGGGKRWVAAFFGVIGLLLMALVAFGIAWAFWG